jgi:hypothetical protein
MLTPFQCCKDGRPTTFDGLVADFGPMNLFRRRLLELSTFEQHALVIEARYEDFQSPAKVRHRSAAFCARAIADLYARFPHLRVVFCSNRKTAADWTQHYFAAVWATAEHMGEAAGMPPQRVADPGVDVDQAEYQLPTAALGADRTGGVGQDCLPRGRFAQWERIYGSSPPDARPSQSCLSSGSSPPATWLGQA